MSPSFLLRWARGDLWAEVDIQADVEVSRAVVSQAEAGGAAAATLAAVAVEIPEPAARAPEFGSEDEKDLTLRIEQTASELKITHKWTRDDKPQTMEQTFTLDGKESDNPAPSGGAMVTRSNWHKGSLVTEGTQQISMGSGEVDLRIKQEFSLSKDGKTLTVKTTRSTARGQMQIKQIFKKSNES